MNFRKVGEGTITIKQPHPHSIFELVLSHTSFSNRETSKSLIRVFEGILCCFVPFGEVN